MQIGTVCTVVLQLKENAQVSSAQVVRGHHFCVQNIVLSCIIQTSYTYKNATLNILQLNICGIRNKKTELAKIFQEKDIHVALLQETLHKNTNIHITGYTSYACECNSCRGTVTYLKNSIQGTVVHMASAQPTDIQSITIWHTGQEKFKIFNIYNPPQQIFKIPDLQETNYRKTIIAGDFNGHSPGWGYSHYNQTGRVIEDLCQTTNLEVLQNKLSPPTLLHRTHNTVSRPDLTIVSSDLKNRCSTQVLEDLGSDHLPILTTVKMNQKYHSKFRARWNFKKANWEKFETLTNALLGPIETTESIDVTSNKITTAILQAANASIPRGCRKNYRPFWNNEIQQAVTERKSARKDLEKTPSVENRIKYNKASAIVKRQVNLAKKEKWANTCENIDLSKNGSAAWSLLCSLSGENRKTNPKPMIEDKITITTNRKKAESFNKHFATVNKSAKKTPKDKELLKELKDTEKSPIANASIFEEQFTLNEFNQA